MGCNNCTFRLCSHFIIAFCIALITIPVALVYLIGFILPSIVSLVIFRFCCSNLGLPTVFDFYIRFVFWPYTGWLCWFKVPCVRYKKGAKSLYLGTIHRDHSLNDYRAIKQGMRLRDITDLNEEYKSFRDDTSPIRIVCISDTHNRHSWLSDVIPNGDLLIHCGDVMFQGFGGTSTLTAFNEWIGRFEHRYKVLIGGNHDREMELMDRTVLREQIFTNCHFLENETMIIPEFGDLKLYGTGWSPRGSGNNAFQGIKKEMTKMKQEAIDILIGHSDLTRIAKYHDSRDSAVRNVIDAVKESGADVHLCGHFHARYGVKISERFRGDASDMMVVNCSSLNGLYVPCHHPIVFDLK